MESASDPSPRRATIGQVAAAAEVFAPTVGRAGNHPDRSLEQTDSHGQDFAKILAFDLLKAVELPTGTVAASVAETMGVVDAAMEVDIDIPGELSIIGFNDICTSVFVGLTTVRRPLEVSGCMEAEILVATIEAPGSPDIQERLPADLAIRETSGIPHWKQ